MKRTQSGLLNGICVLDLADDRGRFCAKLLADLGAAVIRVESPEDNSDKPGFHQNEDKRAIALDLQDRAGKLAFRRLIKNADALVESFQPGHLEALALGYDPLRRINPRIIHLSITGFGQTGPTSAHHEDDSVCAAVGGQMFVTGLRAGKPLKLSGPQSYYTASLFGANAVLLNLRKRKITGKGCHVDLSIQEAVASILDPVLVDLIDGASPASMQAADSAPEPFSILRCKDGYIQIPLLRNWDTLRELAAADIPACELLEKRWSNQAYCKKHFGEALNAIQSWTQNHAAHELFELGQTMGFPWASIEPPDGVPGSPQLIARRFFQRAKLSEHREPIPGPPYKLRAGSGKLPATPCTGGGKKRSAKSGDILRGIRVLDLTRMLAGPFATRILGDFGAEVIKVQSRLTASGMEQNDTPSYRAWNRNKRSIGLDLTRPAARKLFLELVSISDVVVENYSPRVLANWGLTYDRLKAVKPDLILASISAMGQSGPWKNYVGFAPTFHALSGLTAATARSLKMPVDIGFAYGDFVAGLYASLLVLAALENKERTGKGQYIDLSAYEALCTLMAPAMAARPDAAPHGCYPCEGKNRWCVIAVAGEEEWRVFCKILNRPELRAARFSTLERRKENKTALDALIRRWTAARRAEAIVRRLQESGIAAGVVQNAADLVRDRQLAARHFFIRHEHPVQGRCIADRSALWPWDERPEHWKASPGLGEDNHYVLVELLGHSEDEYRALLKKGYVESLRGHED
jgi:crotonobetainyl-CoA:carnitine CoA-transferase CaiB-like acyl-CoA transferase